MQFSLFFLNSHSYHIHIKVQNHTLQPGQLNVTQETYDSVVLQQLRELWTKYGTLDEIWFDGGLVLLTKVYLFINISVFYVLLDIHRL
jgi:hypothetical protein